MSFSGITDLPFLMCHVVLSAATCYRSH